MKASVVTMGCKVNQYESTAMLEMLKGVGYELTPPENADLVVLNTCAVTGRAESEALSLLRRLRRQNPNAKLVGVGCLAQLRPERLEGLADLILGQEQKSSLIKWLDLPPGASLVSKKSASVPDMGDPHPWRTRALHKIQDGCDSFCAYCAVPYARGPARSFGAGRVLSGLKNYLAMGLREVVLTGIHLGQWGKDLDHGADISTLLAEIDRFFSESGQSLRIRLSSLEPLEAPLVREALLNYPWLAPHLHAPLQSGSDRVLKMMGRPYDIETATNILLDLKKDLPDLNLGTDLLIGFPGETDDDFEETFDLAERLPFGYLHVFPFSARPGTRAATLPGQISPGQIRSRVARLKKLDKAKRSAFLESQLGKERSAIVENSLHRSGRRKILTDNYIPALLPEGAEAPTGQEIAVFLAFPKNPWGLAEASPC
ncbi:MAG: MiaB/RimO family radical SAM methylthiotransferase [Deltaproteobacteria bacterium]|jgi:threonylcarbamoyladenosine tRNA methylthiotransferase MtaB|nr:MiaB/RimO family radical SAM methylthiotransferase [Deltaproteobacteria bacterium]